MTVSAPFFSRRSLLWLLGGLLLFRIAAMVWMPVADPSEARYAAVARNMASSGNFIEPQFINDGAPEIFLGKPPLFFQCSALCTGIFGINEFAVRMPALAGAAAILLMLYFTLRHLRDAACARLAVALCAAAPVFLLFAGVCMTDLMLAASVSGAVLAYMLFEGGRSPAYRRAGSLLFFSWLGAGMLVKGPVALVMAGLPVFLFVLLNRRWRSLGGHCWISGTLLFLLIALPWYWLMTLRHPDFPEYFFLNENFRRFLFKEYGDKYGAGRETFRGMAFIWFLLCNLPFVLLLPAAWRRLPGGFRDRLADPVTGLSMLTVVSVTLFWCLTSRVLITYLFPTIPLPAALPPAGLSVPGCQPGFQRSVRISVFVVAALASAALLAAAFIAPCVSDKMPGPAFRRCASLTEYRNTPVYFVHRTPHSAEFYFGAGRLVLHSDHESREESAARSADVLLFASDYDLRKLGGIPGRRELFRCGRWHLFAPSGK